MAEQSSNNSMLYFLVGALLVAVIVVGYLALNNDGGGAPAGTGQTSSAPADQGSSGTDFKIDINKDGEVSGSVEKN